MADCSACQLGIELVYKVAVEFGDDSSVRPWRGYRQGEYLLQQAFFLFDRGCLATEQAE